MQFLSDGIEAAACTVNLILYLYALSICLKKKRENFHILPVICGILFIMVTWQGEQFLPNLAESAFGVILMALLSIFLYEDRLIWRLLAPFLYNIFDIITTMFIYFLLHGLLKMNVLYNDLFITYDRILYILMIYILETALLFLAGRYIVVNTPSGNLILPVMFFISDFLIVLLSHIILYYLSPEDWIIGIFCTAICIMMFFVTLVVLNMMNRMQIQNQREQEASVLQLLLEEQKKQLLQIQTDREKIHALRHDIKHYLLNYQILLDTGNVDAVQADIRQMIGTRLTMSDIVYTNNVEANALLQSFREACDDLGIDFHVKVILPPAFNNIEVFTAIINLFENAIEAEEFLPPNERYIKLEIVYTAKNLSIIVQNRIKESVLHNNAELRTTKVQKELHGYGLRSVRQVVANKNGFIDISEKDNIFSVHLLIPVSVS